MKELLDSFGAERLVWGSDFPFVVDECGYEKASQLLDKVPNVSDAEKRMILGGSLWKIFPNSFYV